MSASPSGLPNGRNPPPAGAPPLRRKPRTADPLVARKKPVQRPRASGTAQPSNGVQNGSSLPGKVLQPNLGIRTATVRDDQIKAWRARRAANGGWWDPLPAGGEEFPLIITKRDIKAGNRFHVMRLSQTKSINDVDPTNTLQFERPVNLHRRDPRQLPAGRPIKDDSPTPAPADEAEAERLAKLKAERDAQRAIDMSQIAPVAKDANPKKQNQKPEKSTAQTYYPRSTDAQKKESTIRYEESIPWVLEDDSDGKNVWVGSYTAPLSESNVALVRDNMGFRVIPLEKYYKFTHRPPFKTYTLDEAEKMMNKKMTAGRWVMRDQEKAKQEAEYDEYRRYLHGPSRVKLESSTFRAAARSEKQDHDDIDMSGDEFQDDDENQGLESDKDEEVKDSRERIRREQLGANLFGDADENTVEKEQAEELMEELTRKLHGKETQRALVKLEKHMEYMSDSEDGWGDSSSDDSGKEDADAKKEGDAQGKGDQKSGTASKGTSTPSSKQKAAENAKKGKSLKRPGSPNLSESSENELARKKKKQATGSAVPSRSSTPMPGQQRGKANAGATSDGEGEMSDGGRVRKIKLVTGTGARGTPVGSRAGSPAPGQGQRSPGSASPNAAGPSTPAAGGQGGLVEAWEITQALAANPQGISVGQLMRQFQTRVGEGDGQMSRRDWIKLVKDNAKWGADKLLRPKDK